MRDISELPKCLDRFISKLESGLINAQRHACDYILDEAKDRIEIPQEARNTYQFIQYEQSLKVSETKKEMESFSTEVYSDYYVWWERKGINVPVGAFLEWGTGPLGEDTNTYDHGYEYTTQAPWDFHTAVQWMETGTWGIMARPHLYPALMDGKEIYKLNVKEAVEEAWKS